MTDKPRQITEDLLHAYVDGFLDQSDRKGVEEHLGRNPQDAERVKSYQQQNAALRALGNVLSEGEVKGVFVLRRRGWVRWQQALAAAAVAVLVLLGAAGGWMGHSMLEEQEGGPDLAHLAAMAHDVYSAQKTHPVEVFASEKQHLDKWLSFCLNASLIAPDLGKEGFTLVGGRLLSNQVGPAAMLMYQNAQESRIIVYVVRDEELAMADQQPESESVGKVQTFYWKHGPLWYTVAGTLPDQNIRQVARSIDQQIVQASLLHLNDSVATFR